MVVSEAEVGEAEEPVFDDVTLIGLSGSAPVIRAKMLMSADDADIVANVAGSEEVATL